MIIAKCFAVGWMLSWFFIILRLVIIRVSKGNDVFGSIFALFITWTLVGFAPVAIVKFGWEFIR